jgi:hypothetical protein
MILTMFIMSRIVILNLAKNPIFHQKIEKKRENPKSRINGRVKIKTNSQPCTAFYCDKLCQFVDTENAFVESDGLCGMRCRFAVTNQTQILTTVFNLNSNNLTTKRQGAKINHF